MVRRHIVEDSEIQQLCRAIYAKHQKALDLIFEHRPDRAALVSEMLQEIVAGYPGLLKDHCSKSYVRFIPDSWDRLPAGGVGWTPSKRMLLFECDISKGGLLLKLVLGPGDEAARQALQALIKANPTVFNKASTKVYPKWWSCHTERWLTSAQVDELDPGELKALLMESFNKFVTEQLPAMRSVIDSIVP
jgi:hypothetical protein